MKNKSVFRIGDVVHVKAVLVPERDRGVRTLVREPRSYTAIVTGAGSRHEGKIVDDAEEGPIFFQARRISVWFTRRGVTSREEASEECDLDRVAPYLHYLAVSLDDREHWIRPIPFIYQNQPPWPHRWRQDMREIMATRQREKNGRWLKALR